MAPDCSSIVGIGGALSKSGKTIYDSLRESPEYFLPAGDLELILKNGLLGLDLNYPLRTRSKVLKSKICEILGYPVPTSFTKSKPRFPGQDFNTYVQKSNNLQIWNEEIVPTRRYVIIRLDESSRVTGVRVATGEILARLDTTGTLTKKYQARAVNPSPLQSSCHHRTLITCMTRLRPSPTERWCWNKVAGESWFWISNDFSQWMRSTRGCSTWWGSGWPIPDLTKSETAGGSAQSCV